LYTILCQCASHPYWMIGRELASVTCSRWYRLWWRSS